MNKSKEIQKLRQQGGAASDARSYMLRLYVTGSSRLSARAVVNARKVCEEHLRGRYKLEILNVADNVAQATHDQVIAAPTLIKLAPLPLRRFIGDMSDTERMLKGLDVHAANGY